MDEREYELRGRELHEANKANDLRRLEISAASQQARFAAKIETIRAGLRGLAIINGGAAAALAAFLQALIEHAAPGLVTYVLSGIGFCVVGTAAAGIGFVFMYFQLVREDSAREFLGANKYWRLVWVVTATSLLCFVAGLLAVVIGGFSTLT